jgi:hypothetical protein
MHRSMIIVPREPDSPLPAEAKARPLSARHWLGRRRIGLVLSVVLHALVLTALTLSVPVFGGPAAEQDKEKTIPVEVVQRPPAPEPEEKKPELKKPEPPEAQKTPEPPKITPPAEAAPEPATPQPPKPATQPPTPAAKTAPPPPPAAPAPKAAAEPPAASPPAPRTEPAPEPAAPPPAPSFLPEAKLPATPPPVPETAQPRAGIKVDADDDAAPPPSKKGLGYWVLDPVTVTRRDHCGLARVSGVIELKEQTPEGHYRGTMRTRVVWASASCPPEGWLYDVELRIKGRQVEMVGKDFVDRGVIGQNTMMLEDSLGRSVWRKR